MTKEIEQKSKPENLIEWTKVGENTYRYRIPAIGWLVKSKVRDFDKANEFGGRITLTDGSICFVPDPDGNWL
jgi:hypothetical protein